MPALSRFLPRRTVLGLKLLGLVALLVTTLAWGVGPGGLAHAGAGNFTVAAGAGTGTISGDVFAPGDITVNVGASITWSVGSDEVHTVAFGDVPAAADPTAPSGFTGAPPNLGTADYNGTGYLNTGIFFKGATATVHFTASGNYPFNCEIHPGMQGTVHVVDAGQPAQSQADLDAKAALTNTAILGQVDALTASATAAVTSEARADGTKLWKVFANATTDPAPQRGGGTGYLELLQYIPPNVQIQQGDSVEWKATSPHTVTFLAPGQTEDSVEAPYGGDPFAVPASKPSENYDPAQLFTSGMLAAGPATTFELTFTQTGSFPFRCLLHGDLGQTGTVTVSARAAATATPGALPKTGGPPPDGGGGPGWALWLALGLAAIAGVSGLATVRLRR